MSDFFQHARECPINVYDDEWHQRVTAAELELSKNPYYTLCFAVGSMREYALKIPVQVEQVIETSYGNEVYYTNLDESLKLNARGEIVRSLALNNHNVWTPFPKRGILHKGDECTEAYFKLSDSWIEPTVDRITTQSTVDSHIPLPDVKVNTEGIAEIGDVKQIFSLIIAINKRLREEPDSIEAHELQVAIRDLDQRIAIPLGGLLRVSGVGTQGVYHSHKAQIEEDGEEHISLISQPSLWHGFASIKLKNGSVQLGALVGVFADDNNELTIQLTNKQRLIWVDVETAIFDGAEDQKNHQTAEEFLQAYYPEVLEQIDCAIYGEHMTTNDIIEAFRCIKIEVGEGVDVDEFIENVSLYVNYHADLVCHAPYTTAFKGLFHEKQPNAIRTEYTHTWEQGFAHIKGLTLLPVSNCLFKAGNIEVVQNDETFEFACVLDFYSSLTSQYTKDYTIPLSSGLYIINNKDAYHKIDERELEG